MQAGMCTGGQSGATPIGALRAQVPRVKYSANMSNGVDVESQTFVGKQFAPNPANKAGSGVIDARRTQTWAAGLMKTTPAQQYALDYGEDL
jgi:hypothetical protein